MKQVSCLALISSFTALLAHLSCGERDDSHKNTEGPTSPVRACTSGTTLEGIALSPERNKDIDFRQVAKSAVYFAFIRVSEGIEYKDKDFRLHWQAAKDAGLIRGVYQVFRPDEDPLLQANILVGAVEQLGPGDLPGRHRPQECERMRACDHRRNRVRPRAQKRVMPWIS